MVTVRSHTRRTRKGTSRVKQHSRSRMTKKLVKRCVSGKKLTKREKERVRELTHYSEGKNKKLGKDDIKMLELEKQRRETYDEYKNLPNNEKRDKLWRKDIRIYEKQKKLRLFNKKGNFNKKKYGHLLKNNSLNINLLKKK